MRCAAWARHRRLQARPPLAEAVGQVDDTGIVQLRQDVDDRQVGHGNAAGVVDGAARRRRVEFVGAYRRFQRKGCDRGSGERHGIVGSLQGQVGAGGAGFVDVWNGTLGDAPGVAAPGHPGVQRRQNHRRYASQGLPQGSWRPWCRALPPDLSTFSAQPAPALIGFPRHWRQSRRDVHSVVVL